MHYIRVTYARIYKVIHEQATEKPHKSIIGIILRIDNFIYLSTMHASFEIEQKPLDIQAVFQFRQLKNLLRYLDEKSPFYKRKFQETSMDFSKVKSIEDIILLPTTSKEDLQIYNLDFLCVPKCEIREYTTTSGTLGNPVTIALSKNDLERLAYNEKLSFQNIGLRKNDIVQLMLTMDRQFMAGIAYYKGLETLDSAIVRSGPGLPKLQWEIINRFETTTLVCVPSFLLKMLAEKPEGFSLENCSVKKILAIGESLRNEFLQENALAKNILKKWDIDLFGTYASTEMQTAFTECTAKQGGHHHPELIIVELLDEAGFPVNSGEAGEVTITTIGVEAMPLLRYRTGDICKAYYEPCSCGKKTMRLGPVLARKKQMIKYKGTSLYPSSLTDLIVQAEEVEEFVLQISKDEMEQDCLTFYLQTPLSVTEINQKLKPVFQQKIRVVPEIRILNPDEMKKMQFPNNSRKPQKIQDLRMNENIK